MAHISKKRTAGVPASTNLEPSTPALSTVAQLANSEFFGIWRDRQDILDSVEFAANLRSRAWQRAHE